MRLIIGGMSQGKLEVVQRQYTPEMVCDGSECSLSEIPKTDAINHLHLLIRRLMEAKKSPEIFVEEILKKNPDVIFITNELGCGVVPTDTFEREWRESTGRICCRLVEDAISVERVFAGLAIKLKG